jgi:hypothetical protein
MAIPRTPRRAASVGAVTLLALLPLLFACETLGIRQRGGLPGASWPARVLSSVPRDGYLDATIAVWDQKLRFFFPYDEECTAVLRPEASIEWVEVGLFGRARSGEQDCDAVGVLSLAEWRDRRPRPPVRPLPRGPAYYAVAAQDTDLALLRGRFPLTGLIGIPGGIDLVAVVPKVPLCRRPLGRTSATIVYDDTGDVPYAFMSDTGLCPILGFALPLSASSPAPAR